MLYIILIQIKTTIMEQDINAFFQENGYYLAKGIFSKKDIKHLEHDFDKIVNQLQKSNTKIDATWKGAGIENIKSKDDIIIHTHNVQQYSSVWLKALLDDTFLNITSQILGEDIILHHSKLFQKPQGKGSPFPMHQDWPYFPTIKDSMIAAVIHVSDATDDMGCFRVYPGSHKLGRLENSSGQEETISETMKNYPIEKAKVLEAKAGDVLFFHYFTLHGSMPNHSNKTRKTVLTQMYAGNDKIEEGNTHPNEKLTLKGWNFHSTRESSNLKK